MIMTIFKNGNAVFRRVVSVAAAVLIACIMLFPGITASAEDGFEMTSVTTAIPNVETQVPQTTQTLQEPDEQVQEAADETTPYEEPVNDDGLTADNLLDRLDINKSSNTIDLIILITILSVAPSILVMMTCFTRIVISFSLLRNAMGVQQTPPNQVMIGLALFLTFFIMSPTINTINEDAIKPFEAGEITQEEALETGVKPLREFMYKQTQTKDAQMFCEIGNIKWTGELADIPTSALIPAFMVSELRTAFIIGFVIYIPFLVIDMVVASALMSMGMMMLPPTTISMPFKILLFVLADGWNLVIVNLVKTFY